MFALRSLAGYDKLQWLLEVNAEMQIVFKIKIMACASAALWFYLGVKAMAQSADAEPNRRANAIEVQTGWRASNAILQVALEHYRKNNYAEALKELNHAIELEPQNRQCYTWRHMVYLKLGDKSKIDEDSKFMASLDPAIAALNLKIKENPRDAGALTNRAELYWKRGMLDESLVELNSALKVDPNNLKALRARAEKLTARGRREEAMKDLNTIASLSPGDTAAHIERARLFIYQRKLGEALEELNAAEKTDSNSSELYSLRGQLLCGNGDYKNAEADYSRALALNQKELGALVGRAYCLARLKRDVDCLKDYDVAAALAPQNISTYEQRAEVYKKLGWVDEAIADYGRLIALCPSSAGPLDSRARLYEKQKNYAKALEDYSTLVNRDPKSKFAYIDRARIYSLTNKLDSALVDLDKALSIDHTTADALWMRAGILEQKNLYARAADDYSALLSLKNAESDAVYRRCFCYEKMGKLDLAARDRASLPYRSRFVPWPEQELQERQVALGKGGKQRRQHEAIVEYGKSIAFDSHDVVALFMRAWNLFDLGEYRKALADLDVCIAQNPSEGKAVFLRALCYEHLGRTSEASRDRDRAFALRVFDLGQLYGEYMHW